MVCNQTFCAGSTNAETNEKWDSSHPTLYQCANDANEADKQVTSNEKEIKYKKKTGTLMTICTVKYFHSWNAETGGICL